MINRYGRPIERGRDASSNELVRVVCTGFVPQQGYFGFVVDHRNLPVAADRRPFRLGGAFPEVALWSSANGLVTYPWRSFDATSSHLAEEFLSHVTFTGPALSLDDLAQVAREVAKRDAYDINSLGRPRDLARYAAYGVAWPSYQCELMGGEQLDDEMRRAYDGHIGQNLAANPSFGGYAKWKELRAGYPIRGRQRVFHGALVHLISSVVAELILPEVIETARMAQQLYRLSARGELVA